MKILLLLLCFSCAKENLVQLSRDLTPTTVEPVLGRAEINYCLLEDTLETTVKTIIMLDASGSNCINDPTHGACDYQGSTSIATDPQREKRTKGLLEYLEKNEFNDNEYFSLMSFFCDSGACSENDLDGTRIPEAKPPVDGLGKSPVHIQENEFYPFTRNTSSLNLPFTKAVQDFKNEKDDRHGTNFRKALVKIHLSIKDDAIREKQKYDQKVAEVIASGGDPSSIDLKPSIYKVVFASDGQPSDTGEDFYEDYLINYIKDEIIALENDSALGPFVKKIYFSAAFYHHTLTSEQSIKANNLIKKMAEVGGGNYLYFDTSSNGAIDFERLLNVPIVRVRTNEEHFIVTNKNTTWTFAESEVPASYKLGIQKDTDGDGLADIDEIASCVNSYDCDSNGLSDKVEKYLFDSQCIINVDLNGVASCDLAFKRDFCDAFDITEDKDNDGLNACEERELGTEDLIFDSNKDEIMDGLAFRFNLDLILAQNQGGQGIQNSRPQSEINSDADGSSNYDEVKHFTPLDFHNDQVIGLEPYQYKKTFIPQPDKPFHKCYELNVTNIPMGTESDTIEIHFVQKEANGSGRVHYKRLERKMTDGVVKFTEEDFE